MPNTKKTIKKILVVNRGEIVSRIIKTAKKMGIQTVAIHSQADANLPFTSHADECYELEGESIAETYLNQEQILNILKKSGADAVHPGYGFFAENHIFAQAVIDAGVIFIGPSPENIKLMSDKVAAKNFVKQQNVPVIGEAAEVIQNDKDLLAHAKAIGLPLMIKAVAGGGGKGMRTVKRWEDFESVVNIVKNEALKNFGDNRIFLEKYLENLRHIEVQVLGDTHGNIITISDRECSIQRFNQKVIEEAPAACLTPETRIIMHEATLKIAKGCGYYSAGTLEFLLDGNNNFYFLEMNTRLQVEHTVTEYIAKLDLVECMIKVAQNEVLSLNQGLIQIRGAAIEVRLCAEDVQQNFAPSAGKITAFNKPANKYNLRIDATYEQGNEVTNLYDSLIAKIITYGDSRKEAIQEMQYVLRHLQIEGVDTNIAMIEAILRNQNFINGDITTKFISQTYPNGFHGLAMRAMDLRYFLSAAIVIYDHKETFFESLSATGRPSFPRDRLTAANRWEAVVSIAKDKNYLIKYQKNDTTYLIDEGAGIRYEFKSDYTQGAIMFSLMFVNGEEVVIKVKYYENDTFTLSFEGVSKYIAVYPGFMSDLISYMPSVEKAAKKTANIKTNITGKVIGIYVKEGQQVAEGQMVLVVESMKMENVFYTETACKIGAILVKEGDIVKNGDILIECLDPD